jgi:hypothetical protein
LPCRQRRAIIRVVPVWALRNRRMEDGHHDADTDAGGGPVGFS